MGEHFAIAQMPTDEPPPDPYTKCPSSPPTYSAGFVSTKVHVVEALTSGAFNERDEFRVVFLGQWFSHVDWEAGDLFLLSLRAEAGEWFATAALNVEFTSGKVEGDEHSDPGIGEVQFRLPTEVSKLRSELEAVKANYATRCGGPAVTDSEFKTSVRDNLYCDLPRADQSIEETGDPTAPTDRDEDGL